MKKFLIVLTVVAMSAFLLVGCNLGTTNTAPVITTTALPDATVGTAYTTTVVATDADNDALTFSLVSELTGMVISEAGVISGWTPAEAGTKAVTVAVTDGKDSVSADFTITVNVAEVAVTGVTLDKTTLALTVEGATGILVETVLPADATDPSVIWASSVPTVATVALGVVTPLTVGATTITVTTVDGSKTATCAVTVRKLEIGLTKIVVDPKTMDLVAGKSEAITSVTATYEIKGSVVPIALGDCTFASDDETIATVSGAGLVTAVAEGTANITVSYGGESDTVVVTVIAAPVAVTGVTLDKTTLALTVGGATGILVETVLPADAADLSVTWTSSDEAVATVAGGVVTPLTIGTANITVTTEDGDFTATCEVTVRELEIGLTKIVVDPETMDLMAGDSEAIKSVTATYEIKGSVVPIALGDCTFASDDETIATVSGAGLVTAVAEGIATITVSYGGESDTVVVTVSAVPVTGVTLDSATLALNVGGATGILVETVLPADAADLSVTWASSDEAVATVAGGVVTPVAAGTATITVTTVDGGFTATCVVTASVVSVTGVTLDSATLDLVFGGATGTLVATVAPATATDPSVVWTSSDKAVATVAGGVVTPVADGEATITVITVDGSFTDTCVVTVAEAVIDIAAISGVTAPVTGEIPVTAITATTQYTGLVTWAETDGSAIAAPDTFVSAKKYTATIALTAKTGYTLTGVTANFFTVAGASATNSKDAGEVVAIFATATAETIDIAAISGVTAPVTGATPVTAISTDQYTGTVAWSGTPATFAGATVYTATITLTAADGYTLTGVTAGFFTVADATITVPNSADSGTIIAEFSVTNSIISASAILGVTVPVTDATPVEAITETTQYTGVVAWSPDNESFVTATVYTATITLTVKDGYTLPDAVVDTPFFTVAGAIVTNNATDSPEVVIATFPVT